jgi:hypothetical protein
MSNCWTDVFPFVDSQSESSWGSAERFSRLPMPHINDSNTEGNASRYTWRTPSQTVLVLSTGNSKRVFGEELIGIGCVMAGA